MTLSVVVIAKNEEHDLPGCLASASFADEIVVVDSESDDCTLQIAEAAGARTFVHAWQGFSVQWNQAIDAATREWVLILAADERISEELAAELQAVVAGKQSGQDGFYMPRRNHFLGRWIAHSGWYPRYELRLFRCGRGRMDGRIVHERIVVDGPVGYLRGDIVHLGRSNLADYVENMNLCTTLEAQEALVQGMRLTWLPPFGAVARFLGEAVRPPYDRMRLYFLAKDHFKNRVAVIWLLPFFPLAKFVRMYLLQRGFLDGLPGFVLAVMSSFYVIVKYFKLWELRREPTPEAVSQ